jgi:hypothetical protein
MNNNEKKFEKFLQDIKFNDTPDPVHRDMLEHKLLKALTEQTRQKEMKFEIWRTIMKSKISKLSTAASILAVAALSIIFINKSASPTWAVEHTVEALESFNAVHISGTVIAPEDGLQRGFNLWARANEDHTQSDDFWLETDDGIINSVQGNDLYHYDRNQNTVRILLGKKASIGSIWTASDFLQVLEQTKDVSQVLYGKDAETARERAFVTCRSRQNSNTQKGKSWWFEFDLQTQLPVRFKQWDNTECEGKPAFDAQKIVYFEDLPDYLFDLEIPEGATVIEQ